MERVPGPKCLTGRNLTGDASLEERHGAASRGHANKRKRLESLLTGTLRTTMLDAVSPAPP